MPILQTISEAPTDGSVVLTDRGYARFVQSYYTSKEKAWYRCDPDGEIFIDRQGQKYYCSPKLWIESPKWR